MRIPRTLSTTLPTILPTALPTPRTISLPISPLTTLRTILLAVVPIPIPTTLRTTHPTALGILHQMLRVSPKVTPVCSRNQLAARDSWLKFKSQHVTLESLLPLLLRTFRTTLPIIFPMTLPTSPPTTCKTPLSKIRKQLVVRVQIATRG